MHGQNHIKFVLCMLYELFLVIVLLQCDFFTELKFRLGV